jgi:hypothetical protein
VDQGTPLSSLRLPSLWPFMAGGFRNTLDCIVIMPQSDSLEASKASYLTSVYTTSRALIICAPMHNRLCSCLGGT